MKDVMVDLETLGTKPGSVIISIGAVMFDADTKRLGPEFYVEINQKSSETYGLTTDQATVDWWNLQGSKSRRVLANTSGRLGADLDDALDMFTGWLCDEQAAEWNSLYNGLVPPPKDLLAKVKVWGNGSDFDNVMLLEAYRAIGTDLPWMFYNNRCYRTLKNLLPDTKLLRIGAHHNALDDAKTQAWHAIQLLNKLRRVAPKETTTWCERLSAAIRNRASRLLWPWK